MKEHYGKFFILLLFLWCGLASWVREVPWGGAGRAYDVTTGEPLAGAWIIAQYRGDNLGSLLPGSHSSMGRCRKGVAIKTDAMGNFKVPHWLGTASLALIRKRIVLRGYKPGYQLAYHGNFEKHGIDKNKLINSWPYHFGQGGQDLFFLPIHKQFTAESWLVALKSIGDTFCGSARYNKNYQDMYKEAYNEAVTLLKTIDKNSKEMKKVNRSGLTGYEYIESTPDDVCNYGLGILSNLNKRWPNGCPWPKVPGDNE